MSVLEGIGFIVMGEWLIALGLETKDATFWRRVATNDKLEWQEGEWWLHDLLTQKTTRWELEYPRISRLVASCWNASFEGRTLGCLKTQTDLPIKIKGTPYR